MGTLEWHYFIVLTLVKFSLLCASHTFNTDIGQQRICLFSFIERNSMALDISWAKIAEVLEKHLKMIDLAQRIREKFQLQAKGLVVYYSAL